MYSRLVAAIAMCLSFGLSPVTPASAANSVEADAYFVFAPEEAASGGLVARMIVVCTGYATPLVQFLDVSCEIYDSSGDPDNQVLHRRLWSGQVCVCAVNAFVMVPPLTWCADVVATFTDGSKLQDRECRTVGNPAPPQNKPPRDRPGLRGDVQNTLECLNPAALHTFVPTPSPTPEA